MAWNAENPRTRRPLASVAVKRKNRVIGFYKGHNLEVRLEIVPPQEDQPDDWMDSVSLIITAGRRSIIVPLTDMTKEEVLAFSDVMNLGFEVSSVISGIRDSIVAEAANDGETSYSRFYRGVPNVVVPEGPFRAHYERIRGRHEGNVPGPADAGNPGS